MNNDTEKAKEYIGEALSGITKGDVTWTDADNICNENNNKIFDGTVNKLYSCATGTMSCWCIWLGDRMYAVHPDCNKYCGEGKEVRFTLVRDWMDGLTIQTGTCYFAKIIVSLKEQFELDFIPSIRYMIKKEEEHLLVLEKSKKDGGEMIEEFIKNSMEHLSHCKKRLQEYIEYAAKL